MIRHPHPQSEAGDTVSGGNHATGTQFVIYSKARQASARPAIGSPGGSDIGCRE